MKRRREQQPAPSSPPRGNQKTAATGSTKDAAADTAANTPKPSRKKGKKQKQKQQEQQGVQVRR